MIGTHLLLTGVTNLQPVALTWPTFFTTPSTSPPPSPLQHEALEPNLHLHPYVFHLLRGLVNIFLRPITFLRSYDVTAPTPHTIHSPHPSLKFKMAAGSRLTAPFYQHCATIYTNRHGGTTQHTHFPILFPKIKFSKIFWTLFRGPGGFFPPFSNSPTLATYPQIFSDVSTSILTSFFTVVPKGLNTQGTKSNTP